jgi:hypothetical protein
VAKKEEKRDSEYRIREEGGAAVFDVTPASRPTFGCLRFVGIALMVIGVGLFLSPDVFGMGFIAIPFGYALYWVTGRDPRPADHQKATTFRVQDGVLEANGRSFKRDEIHRLSITNGRDSGLNSDVIIVHGGGIGASLAADNARRVQAINVAIAKVCYGLEVETGGKRHFIAGGMDETTVNGLAHDVAKRLGLS